MYRKKFVTVGGLFVATIVLFKNEEKDQQAKSLGSPKMR